jgi:hypothetical protein
MFTWDQFLDMCVKGSHFYFPKHLLPTLTPEELSRVRWYSLDNTAGFPDESPYVSLYTAEEYAAREEQLKKHLIDYLGDGKFVERPKIVTVEKPSIDFSKLDNNPNRHRSRKEIMMMNKRARRYDDFDPLKALERLKGL